MADFVSYLIQVNLLLIAIALGYRILLKRLTFYKLNRIYFLISTLYAFILPLLPIQNWLVQSKPSHSLVEAGEMMSLSFTVLPHTENQWTAVKGIGILILIGVFIALIRFFVQLVSLRIIHKKSAKEHWKSWVYRNVGIPIAPFSFFNNVYIHKAHHKNQEMDHILSHEYIHVRHYHSLDIILIQAVNILCWFNPIIYGLKKDIKENLEFLTDRQVLNSGIDRKDYQFSLLKVSNNELVVATSTPFNFHKLKKRIIMMNKKKSPLYTLLNYVFSSIAILLIGATLNISKAERKIQGLIDKADTFQIIPQPEKNQEQTNSRLLSISEQESLKKPSTSPTNKEKEHLSVQDSTKLKKNNQKAEVLQKKKGNPRIVIDEKETNQKSLRDLDPSEIHSVIVLQDAEAIKVYGEKGKDGVILVTTKKHQNKKDNTSLKIGGKSNGNIKDALIIIDDKESTQEELDNLDPSAVKNIEMLKENAAVEEYGEKGKNGVVLVSTKEEPITLLKKLSKTDLKNTKNMLILIDGKESSHTDLNDLDPSTIKSLRVLKDAMETSQHGEKGKNGVLEVITK